MNNGNLRQLRSALRKLSSTTSTCPALTVPRDEFKVNTDGIGIRPSARVISVSRAFKSSWVLPSPT